ncbi:organic solvent tolerance ABC transporter substrate-binding protein [Candidatus Methylomirabilis lanthanidiphila]|uniref:Organic solvent tolerance ABC transporter substrate-binding protein n=1 Tax=Candidatus Methylomirabilis lanthanidiphila TaxID=2211376 RepID=A0A564ZM72_9BACT|nr:ABC transporter substrate-binding protein [Candidatus Methylomirabilis lanthanidiphila]VUZ86429.1 organic solvent tolerance ABC transporter substrate-binding protein [Candidatus Methylomirabilis lanthanidiphila]
MSGVMRSTARTGVLSGTLALGLLVLTAFASASETTDHVKTELDHLAGIVQDPALQEKAKEEARKSMVRERILRWFDIQEMARRSLANHWAKRSGQERKEFVELFGDLFVESYTTLVADHLGDQQVTYLSEQIDGQDAVVKTKFLSKRNEPTFVDFTLLRRGNVWVPYDVVIDEVSIVGNYRIQFDKVIRGQSYEALVKKMRLKRESEGLGPAAKKGSM